MTTHITGDSEVHGQSVTTRDGITVTFYVGDETTQENRVRVFRKRPVGELDDVAAECNTREEALTWMTSTCQEILAAGGRNHYSSYRPMISGGVAAQ